MRGRDVGVGRGERVAMTAPHKLDTAGIEDVDVDANLAGILFSVEIRND